VNSSAYSKEVKKQLYIMGGGGEPAGKNTIFDSSLKKIADFSNNPEWQTTISFNGGHAETEKIIEEKISKATNAGTFDEKNFNKLLEVMITKIQSGELGNGDQLMVSIDAHGAKSKVNELTHSISLAGGEIKDLKTLKGGKSVSLDRLKVLVDLAAEKNVKLAIIDLTCFSGNLLKLSNDKVCLISGTGADSYSYDNFSIKLKDNMKPGKNMEDIFLKAREDDNTPDFPMINTEAGRIASGVYKYLLPYLFYNSDVMTDLLDMYNDRDKDKFKQDVCKAENNFSELQNVLKQIGAANEAANRVLVSKLEESIKAYRNFQKKYEATLKSNMELEAAVKDILYKDFPEKISKWKRMNSLSVVLTDYTKKIAEIEKSFAENKDAETLEREKKLIEEMLEMDRISKIVKAKLSPEMLNKIQNSQTFIKEVDKFSYNYTTEVSKNARLLYNSIYKVHMKNEKNPCREFVL
jgi:soluble cytochrome b562